MQNKNPYYLHQQNQLNVYDGSQNKYQHLNPHSINTSQQFARENSNTNNKPPSHVYPPINNVPQSAYQPPSYLPGQYPYQQQPYLPYQPVQPIPAYQQYDQSSQSSHKQGIVDHCPYCNKEKLSRIGYFICCLLLCVTVVLFWLPFCFSCCHEKRVKCVSCGRTKFVI